MKKLINISLIYYFLMVSLVSGQSDYEAVQKFKYHYKQIEESIKNAVSVDELDLISTKIIDLKNSSFNNKSILNHALYPEDYESSFFNIEHALSSKRADLSHIKQLSFQVTELESRVSSLSRENELLLLEINKLKSRADKDEATIAKLNNLIAQLRGNIYQRDLLVRDLVDTLLEQFTKYNTNLTVGEVREIKSKIRNENLFYNINRTISDNINFINVTRLHADDFSSLKKQHNDLSLVWNQISPKLIKVYAGDKKRNSEILAIDSLLNEWDENINTNIWNSVYGIFKEKNIELHPFTDGNQFVNSMVSFIQKEMQNINLNDRSEGELKYHLFADSIYFKILEKNWLPLLIGNKMLTKEDKNTIDSNLKNWQSELSPTNLYLLFMVAGAVLVFFSLYYFIKRFQLRRNISLHSN